MFYYVVFFANVIQAITGFAGNLLAMPMAIVLIGLYPAKTVMNVVSAAGCFPIVALDYQYLHKRELLKVLTLMLIGFAVGTCIDGTIPEQTLTFSYGLFLLVFVLYKVCFKHNDQALPYWAGVFILIGAGTIHYLFLSGGALLVIYATQAFEDKRSFRVNLSFIWIVLNSLLFATHCYNGLFTPELSKITLLSFIPICLGVFVGNKIHHLVSKDVFLKISYILLGINSIMLLTQ